MDFIKTGFLYTVEHLAADGHVKTIEQAHNLFAKRLGPFLLNKTIKPFHKSAVEYKFLRFRVRHKKTSGR